MEPVWVVNKDDREFVCNWDGKDHKFPVNTVTEVPRQMAIDIFGYGLADKYGTLVRLGWTRLLTDLPQATERLAKYEISAERPNVYRETSPAVDRGSFPVPQRRGGGRGTQTTA